MPNKYFKRKNTYCIAIATLILLLHGTYSQGQTNKDIHLSIDKSEIVVTNGEYSEFIIRINNGSKGIFNGKLSIPNFTDPHSNLCTVIPIIINPENTIYKSYKFFPGKNIPAGNFTARVTLYSLAGNAIAAESIYVKILPVIKLSIQIEKQNMVMPPLQDSIHIPVKIINKGNTSQKITIVLAYPPELNDKKNKSSTLLIQPYRDTLLIFSRKVTKSIYNNKSIKVSITGIKGNGDILSHNIISIQKLSSKDRYRKDVEKTPLSNFITLEMQHASNSSTSYSMEGFIEKNGLGGEIKSNFMGTLWKPGNLSQVNNTYLSYSNKGKMGKIGSINTNGELPINGNGVQFSLQNTGNKDKLTVGWISKSYDLLRLFDTGLHYGSTAWIEGQTTWEKYKGYSRLTYDKDPVTDTKNFLWDSEVSHSIGNLMGNAKMAYGYTQYTPDPKKARSSFMGSLNLSGKISKFFSFTSNNYLSSAYYPGLKKGTTNMNERINFNDGKHTAWISYTKFSYNPASLSSLSPAIGTQTKTTLIESGIQHMFSPMQNITLSPSLYREAINSSPYYSQPIELNAFRIKALGNILLRHNLYSSLSTELSFNQKEQNIPPYSYRSSLIFTNNALQFALNYQKGPFLGSDLYISVNDEKNINKLGLMLMARHSYFSNKLDISAGTYIYQQNAMQNILYSGSISYLAKSMKFWANAQISKIKDSRDYNNIQLGITKLMHPDAPSSTSNSGKITLVLQKDNRTDNGDTSILPVKDYIVDINGQLFITDKTGTIIFNGLPEGNYPIRFLPQKGLGAPEMKVYIRKHQHFKENITLYQTGSISGKIYIKSDSLLSVPVSTELAGRLVVITDGENRTYFTKTNDDGSFIFFVPSGSYNITVKDLPPQIELLNPYKNIILTPQRPINNIDLILKVKNKKINVQRFNY